MLVGSTLRRHPGSAAPAIALAALALVVGGCGGSSKKSSDTGTSSGGAAAPSSGGGTAVIEAASEYKFAPASATAKSGRVSVKLTNNGQAPHAIEIEKTPKGDVKSGTVQAGQSTTLTANLKPGKYEFYCPVDGHRKLGMTGSLTVK